MRNQTTRCLIWLFRSTNTRLVTPIFIWYYAVAFSGCHLLLTANAAGSSLYWMEPNSFCGDTLEWGREAGRVRHPQRTCPEDVIRSQAVWKQLSGRPECSRGMSPLLSRGREFFWPVDQPASLGVILVAPREYMRPAADRPCKSGAVAREIPGDSSEFKAKPREERRLPPSALVAERSHRAQQNAVPVSMEVREMDRVAGSAWRQRWCHECI